MRDTAADYLKEAYSNTDEIPVTFLPDGVSGKTVTAPKKIYPNDPCPCGSGKKYKKCCGKK